MPVENGVDIQLEQALIEQFEKVRPTNVLLVVPQLSAGLAEYLNVHSEIQYMHIEIRDLETAMSSLGRFDFVVVADSLEQLEKSKAEQLISRLRDLHARLLWVMVRQNLPNSYNGNDAVAQGMRMVNPEAFGTCQPQWYEFSLQFYKPVPQWLNAKHWANPERWDKSRW